MVRRNLFQPPAPPAEPGSDAAPNAAPAPEGKTRFPNTGAMSGVKSTLKDLSSNAVREISPDVIDDDGLRDRLEFTDADVASLADSIRAHGQQVPIMVRPIPEAPGRYRVVYGRRRLRALRLLGRPAKALVRSLSDEQAILAQGQENAQRLDPSFIEKALFVAELMRSEYDQAVILDALAIDKPMLSRMNKVARTIPETVVHSIGPAHGVGRRRWEDLADLTRDAGLDLEALCAGLDLEALTSDDRFARLATAASASRKATQPEPTGPRLLRDDEGRPLAELRETARAVTLKLSKSDTPEFARWLNDNADTAMKRLYEAWKSDTTSDT